MAYYNFCPFCGKKTNQKGNTFTCNSCGKAHYLNSLPTSSVFPVKEGRVLLGKRIVEPKKGAWDAIGGFLEREETPEEGGIREAKEESGVDIKPIHLLGIYLDDYEYQGRNLKTFNVYFVAEIMGGEEKAGDDIGELKWFPINEPPENLAWKSMEIALKDLQKWYISKN